VRSSQWERDVPIRPQSCPNRVEQFRLYWSGWVSRARTDLRSQTGPPSRFKTVRAEHVHVCKIKKNHVGVNVLGQKIACRAALHLARMIGCEHSSDRVVWPRGCSEADPVRRCPLVWLQQRTCVSVRNFLAIAVRRDLPTPYAAFQAI